MIRLFLLILGLGLVPQVDRPLHYPLEKPVLAAFKSGDFSSFVGISKQRINVNLSRPFDIRGYISIRKFIHEMSRKYRHFTPEIIEWYERQIDVDNQITTQSLKLKLRPYNSKTTFSYQIIFMLEKKDKKWKIFYLRSLEE